MGWTVNYFKNRASIWQNWAEKAHSEGKNGHECYAKRQQAFWLTMKNNALQAFQHAVFSVTKSPDIRIAGLQMDTVSMGSVETDKSVFEQFADVPSPTESVQTQSTGSSERPGVIRRATQNNASEDSDHDTASPDSDHETFLSALPRSPPNEVEANEPEDDLSESNSTEDP